MTAKPLIGWIGLDVPVEVILAAGHVPVRIDAGPVSASAPFGEGGGQPWMRATAGAVLANAGRLQRIVLGSTPVTGVWLHNFLLSLRALPDAPPLPPMSLVNLSHIDRPSARQLNHDSVRSLAAALGASSDALPRAIAERNAVRQAQRRIDALRQTAAMPGAVARALLDLADQLEPAAYLEQAAAVSATPGYSSGAPVIYSGPGSADLAFYQALEANGLRVAGDDSDFGSRAIGLDVGEAGDPIEALADRYRMRAPAPAGWPIQTRTEWLLREVQARGARAVVFDIPDWSHPAAWDFPTQRQALEDQGIAWVLAPAGGASAAGQAAAAKVKEALNV